MAQVMLDSAKVKLGLKGVLNHIILNGLWVLGTCAALAVADVRLGVVQLCGSAVHPRHRRLRRRTHGRARRRPPTG